MVFDDIFALVDESEASELRASLPEKDAIKLANQCSPEGGDTVFGSARAMRLYERLGLIEKVTGRSGFIFSEKGNRIARQLRQAHDDRVDHLEMRRTQISVLLGQLKRQGKQGDSDAVLKKFGLRRPYVHDIKTRDLEAIYRDLGAIADKTIE